MIELSERCERMVEVPAPGFALPGLRGGPLIVTDDGGGVARQVVSRLAAAGIAAHLHPTVPSDAYGVIHLGGLHVAPADDTVARTLAGRSGGVFVTVQDTGGRSPGLAGPAAPDWPAVKAIDCERGNRTSAAIADAIVRELLGGGSTDVGLRADGTRTTVATGTERSTGELQLDAATHPYLADHDLGGTPVVPVALVLEWFAAAALAWLPEPGSAVIRDLSVLRKIGLDGYGNGGNRVTVQGNPADPARLKLELLGARDARHYRATASREAGLRPAEWTVPPDLAPVPPDVYDGRVLFHGPRFQAIREVHGIGAGGAAAVLTGVADLGWPGRTWHTDPAALDGGLQLAVLWARQRLLGRATLPMGVREYRTHRSGRFDGPTRCVVRAGGVWSDAAECDIGFLGADGTVRAELFGVSLIARPA